MVLQRNTAIECFQVLIFISLLVILKLLWMTHFLQNISSSTHYGVTFLSQSHLYNSTCFGGLWLFNILLRLSLFCLHHSLVPDVCHFAAEVCSFCHNLPCSLLPVLFTSSSAMWLSSRTNVTVPFHTVSHHFSHIHSFYH